jgi:RHS repeat-associated protein
MHSKRSSMWGNLEQAESVAVGLYQAKYDGFGRRAWQEINGIRTYFVYDGDTIVAELDSTGNPVVEYAWGLLGPIARLDLTNPSNSRYYILDALGHTRLLLDNTGNITDTYVYDAWGNLLKDSEFNTPNPFTWNGAYGYEWIEFTGLYHVGAREYDPRTARWLQRDPIGVGGGDPNVYLYCGNEPVNSSDPSGLDVYLFKYDGGSGFGSHIGIGIDWPGPRNEGYGGIMYFEYGPAAPVTVCETILGEKREGKVRKRGFVIFQSDGRPIVPNKKNQPDRVFRLKTTPEQDKKIRAWLSAMLKTGYGEFQGAIHNCTNFVIDALKAGGIDITLPAFSFSMTAAFGYYYANGPIVTVEIASPADLVRQAKRKGAERIYPQK